mgnify:CR=1 FL=1
MTSKTAFADITADKLVNKINDLTIGEDSTDLLVVNSNVDATSGLDVTGAALTTNQAITQTGSSQVTFEGNVGIGTNNPQGQLHISSGTSGDSVLILEADTDNNNENDNPRIEFRQDGDLHLSKIGLEDNQLVIANSVVNQSSGIIFKVGTSNGFSNAVEKMRIHYDGNVGIGTTSPTEKLDINGNLHIEGDYICIRSDSNNDGNTGKPALYFSEDNYVSSDSTSHNDSGNVRIIYDGDDQNGDNNFIAIQGRTAANQFNNTLLHCETGGNVGIGTNNPSQKLEVNGNLKVNGNVESNNKGIVQVKSSSFLGTLSGSSGSWITGLNVSITPSSSTNKIFLNLDLHWSGVQDAYLQGFIYRFVGGGSQQLVVRHNGAGNATRSSFGNRNNSLAGHPYQLENLGFSYLDSPNTTSNISYRVYVRNRGYGHGAFYINYTSNTSDSNRLTGVSTFTAFEVVP